MRVIYGLDQIDSSVRDGVLTIGNFDGVHLGHQDILRRARAFALSLNAPVVAMTFDPHPLSIIAPAKAPLFLTPLPERVHLLAAAGADVVVVVKSDRRLLGMEAEDFVVDTIMGRFHPQHVVEGASFGFGRGRRGTPELLRNLAQGTGCEVHIVEPVAIQDEDGRPVTISSSLIRRLLNDGNVARAAQCLGRPYAIESTVVRGAGRGKSIGYPTANIAMPEGQVEPAEGVYAGRTVVADKSFPSGISIGRSETFGKNRRQIESHLLDFTGDLYHKQIRVEFFHRIRDQQKFQDVDALVAQIGRDMETVRRLMAASG